MKCVEIVGGLGNQMFCYAFSIYLGKGSHLGFSKIRIDKNHNGYELERIFGIEPTFIDKLLTKFYEKEKYRHRIFKSISEQNEFEYDAMIKMVHSSRIKYYIGYWQNEGYLLPIERRLREMFHFDRSKFSFETSQMTQIIENEINSVSIHVRRGDYYSNPQALAVHGNICDIAYYERAIKAMQQRVENARFYVFSDDPQWVKAHFGSLENATYIDWNNSIDSWQDMALMSFCAHHIIANSSFSWWGAWLATPNLGKVVIAPTKWLNTTTSTSILPKNWIKI